MSTHQAPVLPRGGIALPELDLLVCQTVVTHVTRDRGVRDSGGDGGGGGGRVL